jgi:hypothetical protein
MLHVAAVRPASAVTPAELEQHVVRLVFLLIVVLKPAQLPGMDFAVVVAVRWEVGEDSAAVDSLPPEAGVGDSVELVPSQLDRREVVDAGFLQNLRKRGGIAEDVRQP